MVDVTCDDMRTSVSRQNRNLLYEHGHSSVVGSCQGHLQKVLKGSLIYMMKSGLRGISLRKKNRYDQDKFVFLQRAGVVPFSGFKRR